MNVALESWKVMYINSEYGRPTREEDHILFPK